MFFVQLTKDSCLLRAKEECGVIKSPNFHRERRLGWTDGSHKMQQIVISFSLYYHHPEVILTMIQLFHNPNKVVTLTQTTMFS